MSIPIAIKSFASAFPLIFSNISRFSLLTFSTKNLSFILGVQVPIISKITRINIEGSNHITLSLMFFIINVLHQNTIFHLDYPHMENIVFFPDIAGHFFSAQGIQKSPSYSYLYR